ncbi:hypothetical protein KUCAC02_016363, partial [Chaenocephalus aceratus]
TGSPGSLSCMAKRDMITKAAIQMAGADFTFLWLGVMTAASAAFQKHNCFPLLLFP